MSQIRPWASRLTVLAAFVVAVSSHGQQTPAPGAAGPPAAPPNPGSPAASPETAPAIEESSGAERLVERLLFNPRERTARGIEALARAAGTTATPPAGQALPNPVGPAPPADAPTADIAASDAALDAIPPFDTATRLRDRDARSQFNAGTARLMAARADAVPLLESAAAASDPELAARAAFNLGNAHLDSDNFEGAVEAFKTALRRTSDYQAAKHNLEIAQKRLREQQQEQQDQQQNGDQDQQQDGEQEQQDGEGEQEPQDGDQDQQQDGEQEQQDGEGEQEPQDGEQEQQDGEGEQEPQDGEQEQQEQQEQPQDGEQQDGEGQQAPQERPLPNFEDQPDMTAEEAAAILEAVENLEREARRQEAIEAAANQAKAKKDW